MNRSVEMFWENNFWSFWDVFRRVTTYFILLIISMLRDVYASMAFDADRDYKHMARSALQTR
jgi:hypothetical protein